MNQEKSYYQIIIAPNNIFKQQAQNIEIIDEGVRTIVDKMLKTMEIEKAVGLGANMVGILKRIVVVNTSLAKDIKMPLIMINPEITYFSKEKQTFTERSLSFPGIEVDVTRPSAIKAKYLDYEGNLQEIKAEGFLATIIQHEVDYLNGKTFLDYLSKLKSDMLIKKMQKYLKLYPTHVHNASCKH